MRLRFDMPHRTLFGEVTTRLAITLAPTDTLADDALLAAARAYRKLWSNPGLESTYGLAARGELDLLLSSYPDTPLREEVFRELASITDNLAEKEYQNGMFYYKLGNYPGAVTPYFRGVLELYPTSKRARDARIMVLKSYLKLKWVNEVREECGVLRQMYPDDAEVRKLCPAAPVTGDAGS